MSKTSFNFRTTALPFVHLKSTILFFVSSIVFNESDNFIPFFSKNVMDLGKNPKFDLINAKLH